MIIYHVEGFDKDYMQQGTFITTNFEHALEAGKKMYNHQDAEIVYLNYWEDEHIIMIRIINEDGKLNEDDNYDDEV